MRGTTRLFWLAWALAATGCTTLQAQDKAGGPMGQVDREYVGTATQLAALDDQAGRLAASKAAEPRVKFLSNELMGQANTLFPELQAAVKAEGAPPSGLPPDTAAQIDRLRRLNGAAFDHEYVADELAMHDRALAMFQKEATATQDAAMRVQVQAELPVVQQNRDKLKALADGFNHPGG